MSGPSLLKGTLSQNYNAILLRLVKLVLSMSYVKPIDVVISWRLGTGIKQAHLTGAQLSAPVRCVTTLYVTCAVLSATRGRNFASPCLYLAAGEAEASFKTSMKNSL